MPANPSLAAAKGFTLIEIIIGMVVFSLVVVSISAVLTTQSVRSIDPIWQVRSAELARSLANEIAAKSFDQQSDRSGGGARCNESVPCTASAQLGPDAGETREVYNDVDDYHGLDQTGSAILNTRGQAMLQNGQSIYAGFRAQVEVFYDTNLDGVNDDDPDGDGSLNSGTLVANTKLIKISVYTPDNEAISYAIVRRNY